MKKIEPQEGYQYDMLSTPADIAVGGGAAGVGKTYGLLLESIRNINHKGFGGVIFRRTSPEITNEGGLWDTSETLYPHVDGEQRKTNLLWTFRHKNKIKFSHLEYEKNKHSWQGAQIPFIGFDELTHFTKTMFLYLLSRNRTLCGIKPYVRATCNPDPDSFVADFIAWYIDQDSGFPIPERAGKIRYFISHANNEIWGDSKEEVYEKGKFAIDDVLKGIKGINPFDLIKSFTFIPGSIYDNKLLLSADPGYLGNLMAQSEDEQLRLLHGNWKIKISKDVIFNYIKFNSVFSNTWVQGGQGYITADIATQGSDLLIIYYWLGKRLEDIIMIARNNGKEAYEAIESLAKKHSVYHHNIAFDADGVGGGLTGFIENCIEIKNNSRPIDDEEYKNLKAQLYYTCSYCVNGTHKKNESDAYYISDHVADMDYPFEKPFIYKGKKLKFVFQHQLKAIRSLVPKDDKKLQLIPKEEMKVLLNGLSPDFMDAFSQREIFELQDNFIGSF